MRNGCPVQFAIDYALMKVMNCLDWWRPTTALGKWGMRGWGFVCSRIACARMDLVVWWYGLEGMREMPPEANQ